MNRAALYALILLPLPLTNTPAQSDSASLRGDSVQTRKRLAEAQNKLATSPTTAIDELQIILEEAGDDLIPIDEPGQEQRPRHYRSARWIAHHLLVSLPPEHLRGYQTRISEPARKLLERGRRERTLGPLWELLDRYYASHAAQEASVLLGELLFERGYFRTAEMLWRRLLPRYSNQPLGALLAEGHDIKHPDPVADPASIHARVVLAVIFQRERERARVELIRFAMSYPTARGHLGGREGIYTELLATWLDAALPTSSSRIVPEMKHNWKTFGVNSNRTGRVEGRLPRYWQERPTWTVPIVSERADAEDAILHRRPFSHPIIANGTVYLTDGSNMRAFDLKTGSPRGQKPLIITDSTSSSSLSADDSRIYARQGLPVHARTTLRHDSSSLCCSSPQLSPIPLGLAFREEWRVKSPLPVGSSGSTWAGPPLVADGRLWAVAVRIEGGRIIHSIVSYDPTDSDRVPDRATWNVDVCESPGSINTQTRHELLTLAGRQIIYNSNAGVIIALDAATGRRAWAHCYSGKSRRGDYHAELSPAVAE